MFKVLSNRKNNILMIKTNIRVIKLAFKYRPE